MNPLKHLTLTVHVLMSQRTKKSKLTLYLEACKKKSVCVFMGLDLVSKL